MIIRKTDNCEIMKIYNENLHEIENLNSIYFQDAVDTVEFKTHLLKLQNGIHDALIRIAKIEGAIK